jgi:hypothetical protein
LNFVELLQQFQKISEVIHFHRSLLGQRGLRLGGKQTNSGSNLRNSIVSSPTFKIDCFRA